MHHLSSLSRFAADPSAAVSSATTFAANWCVAVKAVCSANHHHYQRNDRHWDNGGHWDSDSVFAQERIYRFHRCSAKCRVSIEVHSSSLFTVGQFQATNEGKREKGKKGEREREKVKERQVLSMNAASWPECQCSVIRLPVTDRARPVFRWHVLALLPPTRLTATQFKWQHVNWTNTSFTALHTLTIDPLM